MAFGGGLRLKARGESLSKATRPAQHTWHSIWLFTCFVGMCAGFMLSQRLYLHWHTLASPSVPSSPLQAAGDSLALQPLPAQPRSELDSILRHLAPQREVMVAISNYAPVAQGMLPTFLENVQKAGILNYVVVAIDKQVHEWCLQEGINVWYRDTAIDASQANTGQNHAISALKFKILREFLQLGWNVLLSDIDVVVIQNPFDHLYRDHDVEGMSDGFDDWTAYGKIGGLDDPSMGWARYAQSTEHLNMNSGLFWLKANVRTIGLMERIAARLAREEAWDQSVYNQEIFFLSHDDYESPHVSVRVMNIYRFMNSKVLFRTVRYKARSEQIKPVMIHVNYHPDKHNRMLGVVKYYIDGDDHALEHFPGGSEPGS